MAQLNYHPGRYVSNRGNTWSVFDQLHRELNQLFDNKNNETKDEKANLFDAQWQPAVDVKNEEKALVLLADLPGVDPDKIEVTAHNGVLTLKGERHFEKESNERNYHRIERSYGTFLRQFTLPETVDASDVKAKYNNGVLEIRLPKVTAQQARRVAIER